MGGWGLGGTGLSHEESTGLGPKAGLTSRQGQQAQVVETLVTIELPLLKQEIHHLSRGGLWLGGGVRCVILLRLEKEGDGTPLQYSCLENPMDGGA